MYSLLLTASLFAQGPVQVIEGPDIRGESKPSKSSVVERALPVIYSKTITHPDQYIKAAIDFLKPIKFEDRIYYRFFLFDQSPEALLPDHVTTWSLEYNRLNPTEALARFSEVADTNRRLYAFRLDKTRWTVESFAAVARRDLRLREPHIDHFLAEELRALVGIQQDQATRHCDVIVPAAWLMRDVFEPGNRNPSLYDLLYSEERFGPSAFSIFKQTATSRPSVVPGQVITKKVKKVVEVDWEGGPYPDPVTGKPMPYRDPRTGQVSDSWPKGSFKVKREIEIDEPVAVGVSDVQPSLAVAGQQLVNPKLLKDFPTDLKDFQERWQITAAQASFDKLRITGKRGEIVVGGKNALQRGSIVAYNDRVIEIAILSGGFPSMRTRDFKKTAGRSNPANDPRGAALGDLQEDAGEHLVTLPSGLQTSFLTGGAKDGRKRVEAGDGEVVHSSKDPAFGIVKNGFSCTICHGPSHGVLDPSNRKITETIQRGVRLFTSDTATQGSLEAFYSDWQEDADFWRLPYKKALRALTQTNADLGWNGQTYADKTIQFRHWYDAPVGLDQAAAELGVPKLAVMLACMMVAPSDEDSRIEASNLFLGIGVARQEWDEHLFGVLANIIALSRQAENPLPYYRLLLPELIRQTAIKGVKP